MEISKVELCNDFDQILHNECERWLLSSKGYSPPTMDVTAFCAHNWVMFGLELFFYEKTHYETMNLNRMCTSKDIRDAFITLSKKYHPDKNHNDPKNHARFVALNEAYSVLSKPEKRRDYDMRLGMANHSSSSRRENPSPKKRNTKSGFPQYPEYYQQNEAYRDYRYDVRDYSQQRRIPILRILLLIFTFTVVGGAVQLFVIKWMFHVSYRRQMDIHNQASAAWQALQEDRVKLTNEENYRILTERYNTKMEEMRKKKVDKE